MNLSTCRTSQSSQSVFNLLCGHNTVIYLPGLGKSCMPLCPDLVGVANRSEFLPTVAGHVAWDANQHTVLHLRKPCKLLCSSPPLKQDIVQGFGPATSQKQLRTLTSRPNISVQFVCRTISQSVSQQTGETIYSEHTVCLYRTALFFVELFCNTVF